MTPSGVRDGDPAALAGLCDRRGPAVLAYCGHVAGDASSASAAADAFGAFRAAVFAAEDPDDINPELLLLNATRHAAAGHVGVVAVGVCAVVPLLLAGRADRSISPADLDRLEEHLATCWTCRGPVARFQAAERAYRDPPAEEVTPEAAEVIVAALTAAAPVRGDEAPPTKPSPTEPSPTKPPPRTGARRNGNGHPAAAGVPAGARLDAPTTKLRTIGEAELEPAPVEPTPVKPAPVEPTPDDEPVRRPARRAPDRAGAVAGLLSGLRASATRAPTGRNGAPAVTAARTTARPSAPRRATRAPRPAPETQLPRPQRADASARRERSEARPAGRPNRALRPSVVLPILLIALALLVALFVAGVFGADDPTPTSSNVPPAAAPPAATTTPEVVVVPGAQDATGAAVERAKARARAKDAGKAPAVSKATTPAPPPPAAVAATPAPASVPARATPAPAPAAATKPKPAATGKPKRPGGGINANNGATGAEQLPPAQDTSTVPELAPPETPAPPGAVPPG